MKLNEAMLTLGRIKASPFVAAERYPSGLKAATQTLTAIPVSQVSVERLFSGLKFILSDQRGAMKADLVEATLILRTNSIFLFLFHFVLFFVPRRNFRI